MEAARISQPIRRQQCIRLGQDNPLTFKPFLHNSLLLRER
jgi:hypothetical protein